MIAKTIRSCFPIAAGAVKEKAEEINKLNVFPVPDGDTGTNMSLTLASVVKELDALPADSSMQDIAGAITHGSLMGARGNSGVITSQILRGIAEGLVDVEGVPTSADVAVAFRRSVKVAFQAVRKPIEGTILTVLRDLSTAADACEREHLSIEETLDALVVEAYQSVARTPDLLPVLKENGVVDSGAFGFAIFLENFVAAALGRTTEVEGFSATFDASDARSEAMGRVAIEANDDWEGSEFTYCTEFLFHAHNEIDEDATLAFLASMGDCELLVGSYPDYKIHVHSNTPDKVLGHMLEMGEIFEVFIHNMVLEAAERTQKIHEDEQQAPTEPAKPLGFVAVAAGEGQAEILKSLGVDVIVSGGQTMNPSTADLLEAVDKVNAEAVIILPNNGNIRMAADAAASACSTKKCAVIPTKSIPQAFSALFTVMPEMEFEDVVETMTDVLGDVRDGEVTCAVRDSSASDGSPIHAGDVMGIICGSIDVVGNDVCKVCLDCITKMQEEEEGDSLVILAGSDMDDDTFEGLCDQIEELFPDLDIDAQRGEQPLYPVIFAIE